jgi:membrane associated rhomboid family serine protease
MSVTPAPAGRLARWPDRGKGLVFLAAMAALMWLVEAIDVVLDGRLDRWGIRPHDDQGLIGLATAPFLHAGFGHLLANTVPFLALGAVIALSGLVRLIAVTIVIALVGGLGVWLFAPSGTVHIGASGIVFGYAAHLVSRGIFTRRPFDLVVGALVVVAYGATLAGGLIPADGISWQGHLFGAIGGIIAAWRIGQHEGTRLRRQAGFTHPA